MQGDLLENLYWRQNNEDNWKCSDGNSICCLLGNSYSGEYVMGYSRYEIFKGTLDKLSDKQYEFEERIEKLENENMKLRTQIDDLKVIEQRMDFLEKWLRFLEGK